MPSLPTFQFSLGKFVHVGVRVAQVGLLGLIIFGLCVLFIISVVQQHFPNAGDAFPSTEIEHYAYNKGNTSCGDAFYEGHRPIRFKYDQDANENPRYEYCEWKSQVTAWRCFVASFEICIAGALINVLWRRSPASDSAAIWQNPKRVLKFIMIICVVMLSALMILLIADGDAVNKSRKWCLDQESSQHLTCDYTCFVTTIVIEVVLMIMWGILILTILLRNTNYFQKYMQLEEEDEIPMTRPSSSTSSAKSSKSSKSSYGSKKKSLFDRFKK